MGNNSGKITKKKCNFSMISNTLALDPTISAKAKGIYLIICAELNKVNYTVYKSTICEYCKDGEASFESGWQELKKAGYLIQVKSKDENGRWIYDYELLDEPVKNEKEQDKNENPDPENRGVEGTSPHPENPGLENRGVYNILEKRKKNTNITSSSSSSINTMQENKVKPIPLDDDDVKQLNNITSTVFNVREGKRLSSIPLKYGCDGNMIYPALKIALDNGAVNIVGYVNSIFKDWKESGIRHLSDLAIDGVSLDEDIEEEVQMYLEQLSEDNKNGKVLKPGYDDMAYEFGIFTDYSKEYRALAKIYPPKQYLNKVRDAVINHMPVNYPIRNDLSNNPNYRY